MAIVAPWLMCWLSLILRAGLQVTPQSVDLRKVILLRILVEVFPKKNGVDAIEVALGNRLPVDGHVSRAPGHVHRDPRHVNELSGISELDEFRIEVFD